MLVAVLLAMALPQTVFGAWWKPTEEKKQETYDFVWKETRIQLNQDVAPALAVLGEGDAYLASELHTMGDDNVISIPTAWNNSPFYEGEQKKNCVNMKGQDTYKFAVTSMVRDIRSVMEKAGISGEQVKAVIPHQANLRIINEARRRLPEIPPERFRGRPKRAFAARRLCGAVRLWRRTFQRGLRGEMAGERNHSVIKPGSRKEAQAGRTADRAGTSQQEKRGFHCYQHFWCCEVKRPPF